MATHAILFSSDRASNARPNESCPEAGYSRLFFDHARRSAQALAGFRVYGRGWFRSWATYCFLPIVNRLGPKKIARFYGFNARLDECVPCFSRTLAKCCGRETEKKAPLVNSYSDRGQTTLR